MDISVVIPLYNEDESIKELIEWIERIMMENRFSYEVILIDDGSSDKSWACIESLTSVNTRIKGIKFRRNYGKSAAIYCGFEEALGDVIITMDADLQDSPDEIPSLFSMVKEGGFDIVSGWKKERHDPISKTFPSKLWNLFARMVTGIHLHDMNCGLKAYRSAVVKSIEVYGEMHRYIPVLAKHAGFKKIGEKIVEHRKRKYGTSKYGVERFVKGLLDLLSLTFTLKFGKRPMHFFGSAGTLSFIAGFGTLLYLAISKVAFNEYKIADRPLFFFGLLMVIFGSQLFLTGFIAELISRNSSERNKYLIEKKI